MFSGRKVLTALIVFILMILITSCDETKRHKVLSFFFDGVPPLKDPNAIAPIAASDPNSDFPALEGSEVKRGVRAHGPDRVCLLCHKKVNESRVAAQTEVSRVPELCFGCHKSFADSQKYVHGPVAVGQCDFCHNPHDSRNESLLNFSVPELCYRCHDQSSIESIPSHDKDTISRCNLCHEAHSSSKKGLLKS